MLSYIQYHFNDGSAISRSHCAGVHISCIEYSIYYIILIQTSSTSHKIHATLYILIMHNKISYCRMLRIFHHCTAPKNATLCVITCVMNVKHRRSAWPWQLPTRAFWSQTSGIKWHQTAQGGQYIRVISIYAVLWILWPLKFGQRRHEERLYISILFIIKFMHVYPCLQIVYTFKLITTLYIVELSALLLSLWNPGIQINQVLLSALQGPWPITDPTRDEERKMYRALHLWKVVRCTSRYFKPF